MVLELDLRQEGFDELGWVLESAQSGTSQECQVSLSQAIASSAVYVVSDLIIRRGFQFVAMVVGKLSSVLWQSPLWSHSYPHTSISSAELTIRRVGSWKVNSHQHFVRDQTISAQSSPCSRCRKGKNGQY
jgi:hypothetical protein